MSISKKDPILVLIQTEHIYLASDMCQALCKALRIQRQYDSVPSLKEFSFVGKKDS